MFRRNEIFGMIGILGFIALIPPIYPRLIRYTSLPFAIFGADIAGDQIFLVYKNGNFPNLNGVLSISALILVILLLIIIFIRTKKTMRQYKN